MEHYSLCHVLTKSQNDAFPVESFLHNNLCSYEPRQNFPQTLYICKFVVLSQVGDRMNTHRKSELLTLPKNWLSETFYCKM